MTLQHDLDRMTLAAWYVPRAAHPSVVPVAPARDTKRSKSAASVVIKHLPGRHREIVAASGLSPRAVSNALALLRRRGAVELWHSEWRVK